jgi:hypothetical protein
MFKIPERYIVNFHNILTFCTVSFAGVVLITLAKWVWDRTVWITVDQGIAVVLVFGALWVWYLASINTVVKSCKRPQDVIVENNVEKGLVAVGVTYNAAMSSTNSSIDVSMCPSCHFIIYHTVKENLPSTCPSCHAAMYGPNEWTIKSIPIKMVSKDEMC